MSKNSIPALAACLSLAAVTAPACSGEEGNGTGGSGGTAASASGGTSQHAGSGGTKDGGSNDSGMGASTGSVGSGGSVGVGGSMGIGGSAGVGGSAGTLGGAGKGGTAGTGGAPVDGGGGGVGAGKLFVGYFQTWSEAWAADGASTKLSKLPSYVNVVNLSFMKPDTAYVAGGMGLTGTGVDVPYDGPTLKAAVAALHSRNPLSKVFISVGGATYVNWAGFAPQRVAAFVNDLGIDGVDLDYEPGVANCTTSQGKVSCPSDGEFIGVVKNMRAALPRPKLVSIAAFSVGAYGEGAWANAPPASPHTGIALAVLKDQTASAALDIVNVMSYDAGPTYDPVQALAAYQNYFKGPITMGIEVPPEAWGGHVSTIPEIDALADAVNARGAAGLMLWSIQKPGNNQQFATEMCQKLGLGNCSVPMN